MACAFGVDPQVDSATQWAYSEASLPPGSHLRGHRQLNARRLREFDVLRSLRGGFLKGTLNTAALLYAWLLSRSGMDREATLRQVERLGRECRPSLDQSACRAAVKTAFARKIKRVTDQIIADRVDVTPEEAEYMERLEPATRFRAKPVALIAPPMPAAQRRSLIEGYVRQHGSVPSCREMAQILAGGGCAVSHVQIFRDYRALKLEPRAGWAIAVQDVLQLCR